MPVLYFENYKARFKEQIFSLQMILAIYIDWSKAQIINIAQRPRMEKIRELYFLELSKLEKAKWSYFYNFWPLGRDIDDLCF